MAKFSPVPVPRIADAPIAADGPKTDGPFSRSVKVPAVSSAGPRKLIRPSLLARGSAGSSAARASLFPTGVRDKRVAISVPPAVHAETFYLQKQAQQRTPMIFVLEDGEHIEGVIEWYDSNAIKIRNSSRMLIYKSSIKYMHKAGANVPRAPL